MFAPTPRHRRWLGVNDAAAALREQRPEGRAAERVPWKEGGGERARSAGEVQPRLYERTMAPTSERAGVQARAEPPRRPKSCCRLQGRWIPRCSWNHRPAAHVHSHTIIRSGNRREIWMGIEIKSHISCLTHQPGARFIPCSKMCPSLRQQRPSKSPRLLQRKPGSETMSQPEVSHNNKRSQ